MKQLQSEIEAYLEQKYDNSHVLHEAMRYSLTAGGKRFRPLLVLLCSRDLGIQSQKMLPVAAALEMIHTYSLIHDDLPALDNDDLRRGKPTNHNVFGEATAILAGDGLLTDAFFEITKAEVSPERLLLMVQRLAFNSGSFGMIKGQSDDLQFEKTSGTLMKDEAYNTLQGIHVNKTGKLIEACLVLPAIAAAVTETKMKHIQTVSHFIGLWFQIRDDILDVSETTEVLGKDAGSDLTNDKLTYVSLFGLEEAKNKLRACEAKIHTLFLNELADMTATYSYVKQAMQ